jgi:hypothetical protein
MICDLFSKIDLYDRWVVPHQLLPFVMTMYGIDPRIVIILVYVWETIEVFLMTCLDLFGDEESVENVVISDPVQGFIGVITALILLNINGHSTIAESTVNMFKIKFIMEFALLALPGLTLLDQLYDINMHWLYPLVSCITIFITYRLNNKSYKHGFILYVNVVFMSVLTFALDTFNSFYTGIIWGICFMFFLIIFKI